MVVSYVVSEEAQFPVEGGIFKPRTLKDAELNGFLIDGLSCVKMILEELLLSLPHGANNAMSGHILHMHTGAYCSNT